MQTEYLRPMSGCTQFFFQLCYAQPLSFIFTVCTLWGAAASLYGFDEQGVEEWKDQEGVKVQERDEEERGTREGTELLVQVLFTVFYASSRR